MSATFVSVVVPTRNRPQLLARTLASALGQEDVRSEVIVVDDGSEPPVDEQLDPAAKGAVKLVRHPHSRGVAAARNSGIAAATGEWLAFLDDDDLWAPTKLAHLIAAARAAGAGFAFSGGMYIDEEGAVVTVEEPSLSAPELREALLERNIDFCCSNVVARADLVRSVEGFDEDLDHFSDWDFALRLSGRAQGIAVPDLLVACTLHDSNMHLDEAELRSERLRFDGKHAAAGAAMDRAAWLRWRVVARRRTGDRMGTARAFLELGWRSRDPVAAMRGVSMIVGGERAMRAARRVAGRWRPSAELPHPPWLDGVVAPPPGAIDGAPHKPGVGAGDGGER